MLTKWKKIDRSKAIKTIVVQIETVAAQIEPTRTALCYGRLCRCKRGNKKDKKIQQQLYENQNKNWLGYMPKYAISAKTSYINLLPDWSKI